MGFELRIAAQRAADNSEKVQPQRASLVTLSVNGPFDDQSRLTVMHTARTLFDEGADSIFIDFGQVVIDEFTCIDRLAADIMSERAANRHIQMIVRERALHDACSHKPQARDWLIRYTESDIVGGRRALHVDGKSELEKQRDTAFGENAASD